MERETYELIVNREEQGIRLDAFLAQRLPEYSRSFLQKNIKDHYVTVDEKVSKASYKVSEGEKVSFEVPALKEPEIKPENIPLDILYEDEDVIVINKPKQMVVHPAPGHYNGTIVNALMYHCKNSLSGINGVMRPGIVHRIDQDTTGVIVACKNDHAHQCIAEQLKVHSITRKYRAIVLGHLKEDGTVVGKIGRHPIDRKKMAINEKNGKEAVTHYHVIDELNHQYTYVECQLETGRTHQIRVHMASIGHPILGDSIYGAQKCPFHLMGQTLHAAVLGFVHPTTKEYMEFEAPLPDYFEKLLKHLRRQV